MKRIIAFILVLTMIITMTTTVLSATEQTEDVSDTYSNVLKANQLINSQIAQRAIRSEDFLYWNFYISADSKALTAYGYRYADALYNMDIMRAITISTINKDDAKLVLEDFICAYTQQNQQTYDSLAKVEGILNLISNGADAAKELVGAGVALNGYDEESLKKIILELTPWKAKLERCVAEGTLDDTTLAWILGGELQKTTDSLNLTQTFDTLCTASGMVANGLEVMSFSNDLNQRVLKLNALKYAASDSEKILLLLSKTAIDPNIKQAAIDLRKTLQIYKNAALPELALMAMGDTTKDYASDHVMEAIRDLSIKAIENNGLKGIATGAAIGVDTGVAVSNMLFNTGDTIQQVNKIRVLALISIELCSKLADVQSEFVRAYDDIEKRSESADEIIFYVPLLLFVREVGEQQYYNLMKSQQQGLAAHILSIFRKPQTNLEAWYSEVTAYLNDLQSQTDSILKFSSKGSGVDEATQKNIRQFLALFNGFAPFENPNQIEKGKIVSILAYVSGNDWSSLKPEVKQILENYNMDSGFAPLANIEKNAQRLLSPEITLPEDYDYKNNVVMGWGDGWIEELRGVGWSGHFAGGPIEEVLLIDVSATDEGQYAADVIDITVVEEEEYMSLRGDIYHGDIKIGTVSRDDPEDQYKYNFDVALESLQSYRYVVASNPANEQYGLQIISKAAN